MTEPNLTDDIARASRLAEGVLHDLGLTELGWRVRSVGRRKSFPFRRFYILF